jgi:hypothetical protein
MIHKNILHDRRKQILKTSVIPALQRAGFKKDGNVYARHVGRIQHIVDVQHDQWNTAEKVSFALNCGIYVPRVMAIFGNPALPEPKNPIAADGILNTRPGQLTSPKRSQWWDITSADPPERDAEIGHELRSLIEEAALPFFARFENEEAVAAVLSQARTKEDRHLSPYGEAYQRAFAAILWNMLGRRDKCQECVEQAVALSRKTPGKERVDAFVKRFSCSDLPPGSGS